MKTIFEYLGMELRISLNEVGNDRFTKEDIISLIDNGQTSIRGYKNHCLCLDSDGAVLAEIQNPDLPASFKLDSISKSDLYDLACKLAWELEGEGYETDTMRRLEELHPQRYREKC